MLARVCRTIRSKVPCRRSSFEFAMWGYHRNNLTTPVACQHEKMLRLFLGIHFALAAQRRNLPLGLGFLLFLGPLFFHFLGRHGGFALFLLLLVLGGDTSATLGEILLGEFQTIRGGFGRRGERELVPLDILGPCLLDLF